MVNVIKWAQTQNQEKLAEIRIEAEATPKTPLFKVIDKLEKAYHKNDIKELVFWLAYAKFYEMPITKAFHFLNEIYAEGYTKRNNSTQMCKYSSLLAEFSLVQPTLN